MRGRALRGPKYRGHRFSAGPYQAEVTSSGAALTTLTHDGRALIDGWTPAAPRTMFHNAVLAPWPNRIRAGSYAFAGQHYQLAVNEPLPGNALHGLVFDLEWDVVTITSSSCTLHTAICPSAGYPFPLVLTIAYTLTDTGLDITLAATNTGSAPAPYGCGIHPYLIAGAGQVDDWTLTLPAEGYLESPAPAGHTPAMRPVGPNSFRTGRLISADMIDHTFGDLAPRAGTTSARVQAPDGIGVEITWDATCKWVQVYTADRPEAQFNRRAIAIEPMTCPPDAFNTGQDLIVLEPGRSSRSTWRIAALPRRPAAFNATTSAPASHDIGEPS